MTAPSRPGGQDTSALPSAARSTSVPASTAPASPLLHYHRADAVGSSEHVPEPPITAWREPLVTVTWVPA